ncbi:MAG: CDP-alcohol phosphatidyltransferase family protein, partial [Nitrososphaerales archaeon]
QLPIIILLNRIRDRIEPAVNSLGLKFAASGLSPNFWTSIGFTLAILSALTYASNSIGIMHAAIYGGIILLMSGFFDIVDGSVARATKKISHKGAFLDSTFDKIAEIAIFLGILYGGLGDGIIVLLALGLSLLVSYARARAESLGIELKGVGIGERAERLIVIAAFSIASIGIADAVNYGMIVVAIIAGITLIQRVVSVVSHLNQN